MLFLRILLAQPHFFPDYYCETFLHVYLTTKPYKKKRGLYVYSQTCIFIYRKWKCFNQALHVHLLVSSLCMRWETALMTSPGHFGTTPPCMTWFKPFCFQLYISIEKTTYSNVIKIIKNAKKELLRPILLYLPSSYFSSSTHDT